MKEDYRTEINRLESLDHERKIKKLKAWLKKNKVEKVGDKCMYKNVECMVTTIDGRFPVAYLILQPTRSNQKINKSYGAPKSITFN